MIGVIMEVSEVTVHVRLQPMIGPSPKLMPSILGTLREVHITVRPCYIDPFRPKANKAIHFVVCGVNRARVCWQK